MCVVLTSFCAMKYISSPLCLPDDEERRESRRLSPNATNVAFKWAAPRSRAHYRKQEMSHLVTLRSIKTGKEPLVDCGMKYTSY